MSIPVVSVGLGNIRDLPDRVCTGSQIIDNLIWPRGLDVPDGAVQVRITCDGGAVHWVRGGRTPDRVIDPKTYAGETKVLPVRAVMDCASDLGGLRFVGAGPAASLDVRYYLAQRSAAITKSGDRE